MEKAVLFKIKKECLNDWKEWCKEVSTSLKKEAKLSLIEEKVLQEATFCFKIDSEWYGLGFVDGDSLPANPNREINKKHKEIKNRCLEFISEAEVLYNIKSDII